MRFDPAIPTAPDAQEIIASLAIEFGLLTARLDRVEYAEVVTGLLDFFGRVMGYNRATSTPEATAAVIKRALTEELRGSGITDAEIDELLVACTTSEQQ